MIAVGTKVRVTEDYPYDEWHGMEGEVATIEAARPFPYSVVFGPDAPTGRLRYMREVELEILPKVYLAGPMTGYAEFNFPAFKAATAELRARGYAVISPAEMDLEDGFEPSPSGDDQDPNEYAAFLARDIQRIAEENIDAIVVLEGWEKSGGVATEVAFVRALGKPVLRYPDLGLAVDPRTQKGPVKDQIAAANTVRGFNPADHPEAFPAIAEGAMLTDDLTFGYGPDDLPEGTLARSIKQQELNGNPKDALAQQEGKTRLDLLEPAAERQIADALANGADKYGLRNFVKAPVRFRVYVAAMKRHLDALMEGEDIAEDSGLSHLAHIGANVHIVLAAEEAGTLIDDREAA